MTDHAALLRTLDSYANGADAFCQVAQEAARVIRGMQPKAAALDALEAALRIDRTVPIYWVPVDPESGRGGHWLVGCREGGYIGPDLAPAIIAAIGHERR